MHRNAGRRKHYRRRPRRSDVVSMQTTGGLTELNPPAVLYAHHLSVGVGGISCIPRAPIRLGEDECLRTSLADRSWDVLRDVTSARRPPDRDHWLSDCERPRPSRRGRRPRPGGTGPGSCAEAEFVNTASASWVIQGAIVSLSSDVGRG